MTTFNTFVQTVINKLQSRLADAFEISKVTITKLNDETLTGLTIKHKDSDVAPTIYLNSMYDDYCNGYSLESIISAIVDTSLDAEPMAPIQSAEDMDFSFDSIKDKLTARVIDTELNQTYLQSHPYGYLFAGLAIIAEINIGDHYRCVITNELAEQYGLNISEVLETARENMQNRYPAMLMSMETALFGKSENILDGDSDLGNMGVLTLDGADGFGGAVIAYKGITDLILESVGEAELYLLPSSLHEWIVLRGDYDTAELKNMVLSANQTVVDTADKLSDSVFKLDADGLHRVA